MEQRTILSEEEYVAALARFEEIFLSVDGTKESEEANILAKLIGEYDQLHYLISSPNL